MSSPQPTSSTPNRLRLHANTSSATRDSILSTSAKGWSPLQISKRDSMTSPMKPSPNPSDPGASPRRTSNSFKHVTRNSLVSNSPFKSPTTVQGQQAQGLMVDTTGKDRVLHERGFPGRGLGQSPEKAAGIGSTPRAAIGLGITASKARSESRSSGGSLPAVSGTRKVSIEKPRVGFPSVTTERRVSGSERRVSGDRRVSGERRVSTERRVSATKENESPDGRYNKRVPRASMGLKGLAKGELVTRSPFLSQTRRIPSGGNDSPSNVSPKSIPVEREDVFSSPSPRRTSGGRTRKVSPSPSSLAPHNARTSDSPTPSPTRLYALSQPSPLSRPPTLAPPLPQIDDLTPIPTPSKSAMTPSRRLRGPRDFSDSAQDSPTKINKTVTFQSVPDVKEFERMSVEGSADGSFEVLEEEWVNEGDSFAEGEGEGDEIGDGSLDEIYGAGGGDDSMEILDDELSGLRITNPDEGSHSPIRSEDGLGEESTTADFVNTLIEEGLFSPPQMATPAFEDQPAFTIPDLGETVGEEGLGVGMAMERKHSYLDTPSLGDSVHATPLFEGVVGGKFGDNALSQVGHSTESTRMDLGYSLPPFEEISPLTQPELPVSLNEPILFNANAAQPSLPVPSTTTSTTRISHQVGPIPDPFITIQTATKVLGPYSDTAREREESGIPLGRTSHVERMQAARMLATQSLGLGMPRSQAISRDLVDEAQGMVGREEGEGKEMLFDASFEMASEEGHGQVVKEVVREDVVDTPRRLPKPPRPEPIGLPSPVASPVKQAEENNVQEREAPVQNKRASKLDINLSGFSLPMFGLTSPFFNTSSTVPNQRSVSHSTDGSLDSTEGTEIETEQEQEQEHDITRPLTPPIVSYAQPALEHESPHRIPSFEFEELSLHAIDKPRLQTAKLNFTSPVKNTSGEIKVASSTSSTALAESTSMEFGKASTGVDVPGDEISSLSTGTGSAGVKVRQRISREMIRETIQARIADGSITRRGSAMPLSPNRGTSPTLLPQRPVSMALPPTTTTIYNTSKELPPPPPQQMIKAHTFDGSGRCEGGANESRPALRPRSQTQSAHEVLRANERDGVLDEPRSALDKIMDDIAPGSEGLIVPVPMGGVAGMRPGSPSGGEGMAAREKAILDRRKEKGTSRQGSESSQGGGVRRRRSMSTGDVGEEAEQAKTYRHSVMNPRLTLGIEDDGVSMADAFREEARNIGAERGYKIREKPRVRATYGEKVNHTSGGDVDSGRAWRSLRRPSDMNEHAAEIRAMRAREATSGKASGTIFVKVLGIEGLQVPIPDQQTMFCITLDNGIDYIRTPYSVLAEGARVNQEFSLVEHPNFEFSLSLDIRRDPHILKLLHEKINPQPTPLTQTNTGTQPKSGFRALFGSPRKPRPGQIESRSSTPIPPPSHPTSSALERDNLAKYLSTPSSSTIAKTHVAFKPIAKQCEAKVLEIRYPMFAMFKGEPDRERESVPGNDGSGGRPNSAASGPRKQIAKITLQIFRLPPLAGMKSEELPGCIDDCLRGMRHHAWHEGEYHEGVLTQEGGDCTHPKRRLFKLIGGNLIAINEVTKKQVSSIDLRKAEEIVDLNAELEGSPKTMRTTATSRNRGRLSDEALGGGGVRPRSFRIEFRGGEGIIFGCDKDEDKVVWMTTLEGLIGKIPSNPLWAELLAQKMRERQARRTPSSQSLAKEAKRIASGGNGKRVVTKGKSTAGSSK